MRNIIIVVVCIVLLGMAGCKTLLDELTPTPINKRAMDYTGTTVEELGLIPSLADAKRIRNDIIIGHRGTQIEYKRAMEDDNLAYDDAYGFIKANIAAGEHFQSLVIGSEDNPFSLLGLIASFGLGGVGVSLGRKYLKRPGDFSPQEHAVELLKVKNGG